MYIKLIILSIALIFIAIFLTILATKKDKWKLIWIILTLLGISCLSLTFAENIMCTHGIDTSVAKCAICEEMICTKCDTEVVNPNAEYCSNCGKKLVKKNDFICARCNTKVEKSDNYCLKCGAELESLKY